MNVKNLLFNSGYTVSDHGQMIADEKGKIHDFLAQYNFKEDVTKTFIDENKTKHFFYKNPAYLGIIEVIQHEGESGYSYVLNS